jgi:aarF domain-containing kinase
MNKYSQDIFGVIRGIGLVANASLKSQEAYAKHIWSHSSVREAFENNAKEVAECGKKIISNPSQELQNINHIMKETVERSSIVATGLKQFMSNGRTSEPIGSIQISDDTSSKSFSSIKNIKNLDIASITLKELENLLAEHNKIRDVNLRMDDNFKAKKTRNADKIFKSIEKKADNIETIAQKPKVHIEPTSNVINDEKKVENMMNFITNYDKKSEETNTNEFFAVKVPEVR